VNQAIINQPPFSYSIDRRASHVYARASAEKIPGVGRGAIEKLKLRNRPINLPPFYQ